MLRVLLLAHHCSPDNPSEPRVAYEWARHLQSLVELTVITHERNRSAIEASRELRCRLLYVPVESISRPIWRLNSWLFGCTHVANTASLRVISYLAYEIVAGRLLSPAQVRRDFDLVHRVSPKCLWWPTWGIPPRMPFILGPVNSGMDWPAALRPGYASPVERLAVRFRAAFTRMAGRHATMAARILVANPTCLESLPSCLRPRCAVMPDSAIEPTEWSPQRRPREPGPFRLLFVGRLIPLKGLALLLKALATCSDVPAVLSIAGDGPLRSQLISAIPRLGLSQRVKLLGHIDRRRIAELYATSDAFVFPSLREAGGNVVYEAMAAGLPVIAIAHGGPATLLGPDAGLLIQPSSPDQIVIDLADAIRLLATDPDTRDRIGQRAADRIRSRHTWTLRARQMLALYEEVVPT